MQRIYTFNMPTIIKEQTNKIINIDKIHLFAKEKSL